MTGWLDIKRGEAPLVVAFPHTGTDLVDAAGNFRSEWIARRDTDWWVDQLYDFAVELGATTIRTGISRSVIDVNRDPSGASLYPGQATTELCPTTTFDGEPLYRDSGLDEGEIARRRSLWFDPYHAAIKAEIARLKAMHRHIVLYDAHSIRSHVPRLFEGALPQFNIGTNDGSSCDPDLTEDVADAVKRYDAPNWSLVVNGRFKGGWTTRHYGRPEDGVHAIQMELSMRGYMREPAEPTLDNWPAPYDATFAAPMSAALRQVLGACIAFAQGDKN